ncbi:MAG: tail protein X [Clostridia bacterium]|nr:tail protein X [Clostridia bacterium]
MILYSGLQVNCAANDSFDSLALAIYGDEKYAADLMNANPALCGMTVFNGGEKVLLPVLDVPGNSEEAMLANTIAPWK